MHNYQRKTERGLCPKQALSDAVKDVISGGLSLRKVAVLNGVNYKTLSRYIPIYQANHETLTGIPVGYQGARKVLNPELEQSMVDYIKKVAAIYHVVTIVDLRKLAYDLAIANKVENIPNNWEENKMAGYDWAKLFLKRHYSGRYTVRCNRADIAVRVSSYSDIES